MGAPIGTFSHPKEGRLRVIFNSRFLYNGEVVAEPPGGNSMSVRCYVGEGDEIRVSLLSYTAQTAVIEVPYQGGYAAVPVGMNLHWIVDNALGPTEMKADRLLISCHLLQDA